MAHLARQESSVDDGTSPTNTDMSDTGVPSSVATLTSSDVAATEFSPSVTADLSVTDSAATPAATDNSSNTAAASTPDSTDPPTSQVTDQTPTSGGASDVTITTASSTDPSQSSEEASVTSDPGSSASISNSQPSLTTVTDSTSASLTSSFSQSTTLSVTSTFSSSTESIPSSTAESTSTSSTSESSSTIDSISTESPTDSSSSLSSTGTRSTSLTTSYTEVISTVNGQVTTIFSPVATLNAETSTTLTSNNRTAVIAGVTAGSAALIILLLLGIFLYRRHQKRKPDQSHRYLPTPRSVMLSGEDDFDLAGPQQPQRSLSIFGPRTKNHGGEAYRGLDSDSRRGASSPVMRELPTEPPPRLLRPVASKTGSYFQEAVWPPPGEGSRLSDPLMASSQVDLHGIVDEVMGQPGQPGRSSIDASSSSSPPHASRLRGGAAERSSLLSDSQTSTDFPPHVPPRHVGSPAMSSSIDSGFGEPLHHLRDWSTDSATGLLANVEGSPRGTRRTSGSSGAWLPPGAAAPSVYGRPMSPLSPLRSVTEPQQNNGTAPSFRSSRVRGKASEAAQERRGSMTLANPSPDDENASSSVRTPSFSVSTTSTQRLRRLAGTLEATGEETPYPDESPIDRRSIPPSLAHAWLLDVDDEDNDLTPRPGQSQRDEIPPRYDMIRRDSEDGLPTRTTAL